jgi:Zn-dependent protease with chaperone function
MIIREPKRRLEIRRLEELAATQPDRFRAAHRAAVFRALGWLILCQALPLVTLCVGVAGLIWVDGYVILDWVLTVGGLLFTLIIAGCLVVRLPEASSLTLDRGTHALLFRDINEIRQRIDAPKFSEIRFTMALNASVAQQSRWFGLLGVRNTLYIGFPLIFCLTRSEFKTVLAHEIAHVSGRHSLSRRWMIQVQASIVNIYDCFSGGQRGRVGRLMEKWLDGFMPSMIDHGLVASRLHEREADRIAATACGVEACSQALVKIAALAVLYEEDFQESLNDRVRTSDHPNVSILEEFQRHVDAAIKSPHRVRELLGTEILRASDLTSTHPSLSERLSNIGGQWKGDVDMRGGAAEEYFGRGYNQLRKELDRNWVVAAIPLWRQRNNEYRALEAKLHTCSNLQDEGGKLYGYELMNIAVWSEELYGPKHGLSGYADYHQLYPQVYEGRYHYGRLLLANNDELGIAMLEPLVGSDPSYREAGLLVMRDYYYRKRSPEKAHACEQQLEVFYRDMKAVLEDRFEQKKADTFCAHGMPLDFQESLYRLCGEFPQIQRLHLVRKEVRFFKESPFFVMLVSFNYKAGLREEREKAMRILRNIVEVPGDCIVVDGRRHRSLKRRLKKGEFASSKIYDQSDG